MNSNSKEYVRSRFRRECRMFRGSMEPRYCGSKDLLFNCLVGHSTPPSPAGATRQRQQVERASNATTLARLTISLKSSVTVRRGQSASTRQPFRVPSMRVEIPGAEAARQSRCKVCCLPMEYKRRYCTEDKIHSHPYFYASSARRYC